MSLGYFGIVDTETPDKIDTIRNMIAAERQEISAIKRELRRKTGFLHGLETALAALVDSDATTAPTQRKKREPTGRIARVIDFLRETREPQHLDILIEALGENVNRETQTSFRAQIGKYVNKHHLISRPAPNIFGLIEWGDTPSDETVMEDRPEDQMEVPLGQS